MVHTNLNEGVSVQYMFDEGFFMFHYQDGVITDLQESINSLVEASSFPLSVLIVGVGGADFTEMEVCLFTFLLNSDRFTFIARKMFN